MSEPVARVDTAGAVVFLAGPDAYKVKRAVTFPFMDLSTLDKRRLACEAEIAVNRASAPDVYLAALPITRSGKTFAIDGRGEVVEWVTHMRRFDENATLDRVAGAKRGDRRHHRQTGDRDPPLPRRARRRAMRRAQPMRSRPISSRTAPPSPSGPIFSMPLSPASLPSTRGSRSRSCGRSCSSAARPGFARRCHGDLHLRNIVLIDGEPTLFDAVEFSDAIASGDVLYDLAFLLMDLEERGLRASANRLFNRYLAPEPPEAIERPRRAAAVPEPARGDPGQGRSVRGRTA